MTTAPRLSDAEIGEFLGKAFQASDHRPLFALFGEGEESVVEVRGAGQYRIVPTQNELELRIALPPIEEHDGRIVFLVPWSHELPLDIAGRFAKARVQTVGRTLRLQRMFDAASVEDAAVVDPLALYLLRWGPPSASMRAVGGKLTRDALWSAWLTASFGIETEGGISLSSLLAWATTDQRGQAFRKELDARDADDVGRALRVFLDTKVGKAGPLVWNAWEQGRGRALLELATLFEGLARAEDEAVRMWLKLNVKQALGVDLGTDLRHYVSELGAAAFPALQWLEKRDGLPQQGGGAQATTGIVRAVLEGADARIDDESIRRAIIESPRLPSAWRGRLEVLGRALTAAAASPTPASVAGASAALRRLELHQSFKDPERLSVFKRAEMAVRLAAWLAARPDKKLPKGSTPYAEVERLARWYAEEGGYVDWARRRARGSAESPINQGIRAVVAAADAARTELDLAFARALPEWVRANRPAEQVLPLDQAVARIAGKFLQENDARRVLVILFDGMAWAQAVELLQSMGSAGVPWGPLAWHRERIAQIGSGLYPPTLAGLPTITEVSRAAFFAGQPMPPGPRGDTSKDPDRWAKHKTARALIDKASVPRLFLRAESHTLDGAASKEALSLVRDPEARIVALVINAIDSSLKSDSQQHHEWTVDSIKSLRDLLDAAQEAGRSILMTSDHGHVPADRLVSAGGANTDGGARWRPWKNASDPIADYEVGFEATKEGSVWAPAGAHGTVLLADDAHRYGGAAHAGEHGGATLAEVIAPTLLIGPDSALLSDDDPALATQAAYVPAWWYFDIASEARAASVTPPPAPASPPKKKKNDSQLELLAVTAANAPSGATFPSAPGSLAKSAVFAARATDPKLRALALQVVDYLVSHDGVGSIAALAAMLGVPGWRMKSLASPLTEILNADSYQVLRIDFVANEVKLDVATLEQLFEVKL